MKKFLWALVYINFMLSCVSVVFLFVYAAISVATSFNEPEWMDDVALGGICSLIISGFIFGISLKSKDNPEDWETINNGIE